ncbi:5'-nucleotidase C-terminal domain-containing protein, partial [bacterium]|nr:5'-nucleotidase C-terminal domain-containing protein [bacterium]
IVGGHQHTRLYEPDVVNGIPILQAGANGMFLGFFQATYDPAIDKLTNFSGKLLPVYSDSIRARKDIADLIAGQEVQVAAELDRVIGELTEPWIRHYRSESNVGNWTADAIVKLTGRDIAFMNSGGLRRNVSAGSVKVRDIWEVHPFGNAMQAFEISAQELQQIVQDFGTEASDFLQVGGMRFKVKRGSGKILELTIGGKPLDPHKTYTVAANAFIVGHDEKYFGFSVDDRQVEDLGWIDRDIALKAFEDEGTVTSIIDGRITIVD